MYTKQQKTKIATTILKQKNEVRKVSLPDFKTYYIAKVMKTVKIDTQINGTEESAHKQTQTNTPN